jgi:hypothetical protein
MEEKWKFQKEDEKPSEEEKAAESSTELNDSGADGLDGELAKYLEENPTSNEAAG